MIASSRLPVAALIGMAAIIVSSPAEGAPQSSLNDEGRVAVCIRQASRGRGWLEKTLWALRDQEAGWVGAAVPNSNGTYDLGPLQVNSFWVPKLAGMIGRSPGDVRLWLISDPCFNVQAARWIFLSALKTTGDYWRAIGVYHSPTDWRQRRYISLVVGKLTRRFGGSAFAPKASNGR
ncbi:lytic transglycosylase domain-containing protein [Sphingomonas abietis]|uniref:Lytic transglycosylase domain-containing protein n=1 Tax=Sphingomonas abietis TaxID=3012344 RepID=A0ABY7NL63_9SPHN|nr:lytic transglycosylase domain-containing protein [Sphingomonas abietis]WBO21710.1 lytic transglycosylase domain-containing protein [Sphingomonas abietis]